MNTNIPKLFFVSFSSKARVKTTWFAERPNVVCDEKCKNKKPTETTINQCEKK